MVFNSYPLDMLIYCEDDLGFMCKLPPEITPNTSSPWTIGTLSCGIFILIIFTLAITVNCLISRQEMYFL
jgi:hypothetical protein